MHVLGTELDADGARVSVSGVDCVSQVDQEGRAHPAESCHNIMVRQLLTVEEVCVRDTDGVCGPEAKLLFVVLKVQCGARCLAEEAIDV